MSSDKSSVGVSFTPFVYWAQNQNDIYLKIDLKDVKSPVVHCQASNVEFQGRGVGAQGLHDYAFSLPLHGDIQPQKTIQKLTDNRLELTLSKATPQWWPKLQPLSYPKPPFVKLDHDRFNSEELVESNARAIEAEALAAEAPFDIRRQYPNVYEQLKIAEYGYKREDFQKVYLTLYNLCMYVGFMYVVCVLLVCYLKSGPASFAEAYDAVGAAVCCLQLLQLLEVLHPLFGYVAGGWFLPLLQVGGRIFIAIAMLELEPRLQRMPVVFYLFVTWSAVEIIRYPYYMSRLLRKEHALLTWLRYSAWIVLYPIGFVCEGVIVFRNLIYMEQDDRWSVAVGWPVAFTFRFAHVLRVYLLLFIIPAAYTLMRHMYKARGDKIGPKIGKRRKVK